VVSGATTCPVTLDLTLSTEVGSGAATCPAALGHTSWLRWAPALPRVLWL
jgi:hypothetical protein